jgi:hypothetical protein
VFGSVLGFENCNLATVRRGIGLIDVRGYSFHHRFGKSSREMSSRDPHESHGRFVETFQARIAQEALADCGDYNGVSDLFLLDRIEESLFVEFV